jgi:hypothetical protein
MMNLERIWKEAIVVYSRYFLGICLNKLRETGKNLGKDKHMSRPRFEANPPRILIQNLTAKPTRSVGDRIISDNTT